MTYHISFWHCSAKQHSGSNLRTAEWHNLRTAEWHFNLVIPVLVVVFTRRGCEFYHDFILRSHDHMSRLCRAVLITTWPKYREWGLVFGIAC